MMKYRLSLTFSEVPRLLISAITHGNMGLENLLSMAVNPRYSTENSFMLSSTVILCTSPHTVCYQTLLHTVVIEARQILHSYKRPLLLHEKFAAKLAGECQRTKTLHFIHAEWLSYVTFPVWSPKHCPCSASEFTASVEILQANDP